MFESDLPTEQELEAEFAREIQLLKDLQKVKMPEDFSVRLREAITKPSGPVVSPYSWSVETVLNGWGGRLIPVTLLLLVIVLGGGYYSYEQAHLVQPEGDLAQTGPTSPENTTDSATQSSLVATDNQSLSAPAPMMMKTMAGPESNNTNQTQAVVAPADFNSAQANIFNQGLTDQPESDTTSNDLDSQNDFSPMF